MAVVTIMYCSVTRDGRTALVAVGSATHCFERGVGTLKRTL